ncbi:MAG TPA: hypothetical protein VF188_05660 [Longimicrobiales bacterium]
MCRRTTPSLRIALALPALIALHASPGAVPAAAQVAALAGRFAYVADESDDIEQAIDRGTAELNFFKRPIARGRLRDVNAAYQTVEIEQTRSSIAIGFDGHPPIVTPADGAPIRWRRDDGEVFRVRAEWLDDALIQVFTADDGQRENLYTLDPDGRTLRMRVTITSRQLPAPIVYTLVYRRVE